MTGLSFIFMNALCGNGNAGGAFSERPDAAVQR
jgi:hypothetical protein